MWFILNISQVRDQTGRLKDSNVLWYFSNKVQSTNNEKVVSTTHMSGEGQGTVLDKLLLNYSEHIDVPHVSAYTCMYTHS